MASDDIKFNDTKSSGILLPDLEFQPATTESHPIVHAKENDQAWFREKK